MINSSSHPPLPTRRLIGAALLGAFALPRAWAQNNYPNRPIRIVVPNGAGTGSDTYARIVGQELGKRWNVPVIVENRAGAEGRIAARYIVTMPADGHTLFLGTPSTHAINPLLYKNAGYDPARDMTTIALMSRNYVALCVPAASPIKSVADLIATAKATPGKMNMGGGTSFMQIGTLAFLSLAGVEATYVPFKSSAAAVQELMAGRVDAMFVDLQNAMPQIRGGTIRVLATTGPARLKLLPDAPSIQESGFPGFQMSGWGMLGGPAGLPAPIVEKLNNAVRSVLAMPEVARNFTGNGSELVSATPAEANEFINGEIRRWKDMMARSGVKPE